MVVKWRRAVVVHASAGGNTVPVIAELVATAEDRVREMIHRFNDKGMASLDPQWVGGRPRRITTDDEAFIVKTAGQRPEALGQPFTRWSLRKLVGYLGDNEHRVVKIGRERLREILGAPDLTFQRTKTWKETNDPDRDAKLDRIDEVLNTHPTRCFAFDGFGPLPIRPTGGSAWAPAAHPQRQPANYNKLPGVRQFHGCYSIGDDELFGIVRHRKSATCAPAFRLWKLHLAQRWLGALYDVSPLTESKNDGLEVGVRHLDLLVEHSCILAVVLCCALKQFPRILWLR